MPPSETAPAPLPRLPRFWGLAGRGDVELVDLYTRGSLHLVYWLLVAMGVVSAAAELDQQRDQAALAVVALVVGLAAHRAMTAAVALYPAWGPFPRRPVAVLLAVALPAAAWVLLLPDARSVGAAVLVAGMVAWGVGGLRDRRVQAAAVVGGGLFVGVAAGNPFTGVYGAAACAFFAFTVQSSLWLLGVVVELDRGRTSQAALAVAEERLRFSRDVHDVMGRHLSTIAVQAELAAALAERGDPRAPGRVREVRATAHEALREARELARGYRPLDLAQELEGAVALLGSAGIAATADLDGLPEAWHPPVARVVREAVTNVLRHSRATRVGIGYADGVLVVRNDGVAEGGAVAGGAGDGTGLATLADDVATLGARLDHERVGDEFVLRLRLAGDPRGEAR
ncbi:sensor histidine kinase [Nocardioides solisilvae]|uniref:sensor histidine kinase n=1 Tax=Nocardioides solisilvae TaxID=1542435 RepID=UPI0013A5BC82|nr:histidine kinase [Nocardioides solisilvae]